MAKQRTDNLELILTNDSDQDSFYADWVENLGKINQADKDRQADIAKLGQTASLAADFLNVKSFGAVGNGTADDTAAFVAAIAAAAAGGSIPIYVPPGTYRISSTLNINARGITFFGARHGRPSQTGGSRLFFSAGTGPLFQLGSDNNHAYDVSDYDGVQSFTLRDISAQASQASTPLSNGSGNYDSGTYFIRDWRGGDITLERTTVENFEFGFWGIQSDLNHFTQNEWLYCANAIYLGPRSDQFIGIGQYFQYCDRAIDIDAARDVLFVEPRVVACGSTTINPVRVRSTAWALNADGVTFQSPWVERLFGTTGQREAFIEVGVGDTTQTGEVVIRDATVVSAQTSDPLNVKYFLKVGNAKAVAIEHITHRYNMTNLVSLVSFVGASSPTVAVLGLRNDKAALTADYSASTGSPSFSLEGLGLPAGDVVSASADYTASPMDGSVLVTTGTSPVIITLPPFLRAKVVRVSKVDTGAGLLTVKDSTGTTVATTTAPGAFAFICSGSAWTEQSASPGLKLVNGKLDPSVMPALAISDTFDVTSQAQMLALTAQRGDIARRLDLGYALILVADDPSTLANWKQLDTGYALASDLSTAVTNQQTYSRNQAVAMSLVFGG